MNLHSIVRLHCRKMMTVPCRILDRLEAESSGATAGAVVGVGFDTGGGVAVEVAIASCDPTRE